MKLNIFKRSMLFATFFGSCLCIALVVASLGTPHWIDARARKNSNPLKSEGRINFGLFEGRKELNSGYGLRYHEFSVKAGSHPARRYAWCGAAALLAGAAAAAGGGAVAAALAAAGSRARPRPLLLCNALVALLTAGAMGVWLTEYHLRLQHNVLAAEDLANAWSSDGTADLGLSFWLIVGAMVAGFTNIVCVCVAMADGREFESVAPALEEKTNGAIMLY